MRTTVVLFALMLLACGPISHTPDDAGPGEVDSGPPAVVPPIGASASEMIDAAGGTIELDDFEITIPAGALSAPTQITVTVTNDPVPDTFTGFSPVFQFEPAGLVFDAPVTVRLPFAGDVATATVFWTASGGTSFVALPTTVEGNVALVQSTHFSSAFVGTACSGDCCGRGNGELDVVLMVDNSNSMTEEQASLAAQIPRMVRVLATGDIDQDGVQDFPAVRSLRMGTVTSDMGTGGFSVPTCLNSDFGDDGILRTQGNNALGGCATTYPSYSEFSADDPTANVDAFVQDVSCVATVGTGGCGFEQQLDAVLKAVTPSTSPIRFFADTVGQADRGNAGFQRPESILATILLTDETDCSAIDPEIFNPTSPTYGATDLNLRCFTYPEALHPVSRYADGLRALRSNPDDVIYALIAGVPQDLVSDPSAIDYDAILSDSRMQEVLDPAMPNRLAPSCNVPDRGIAFPPVRLVQVARELGPNSVVQSICQADFTPAINAILQRVAARVSGACGG